MLSPDTILQNRYRIIRQLGKGGMGTVYEALDQRVSAIVALKEANAVTDDNSRREFEREARLLANLHHQALPQVMDYFIEAEGEYLVMEFISGYDLLELLKRRGAPFHVNLVLRWADELLNLLEYLHGLNPPILHRDIKPANLKLTQREEIYLLDFGLAKGKAGHMATLLTSRSVRGYTPVYAPLEQILGQGTDARSDLYSLGATLYHLLTNALPTDAPTRDEYVEDGKRDPLLPISQLNAQVPPGVAAVIHQAMAIRRKNRPESAAQMRSALRRAQEDAKRVTARAEDQVTAGENPHHREPPQIFYPQSTRPEPPPRQGSKSILLYLLAGFAALILGGALVLFKLMPRRAPANPSPTPEDVAGPKDVVRQEEQPASSPQPASLPTPKFTPQVNLVDLSGSWNGVATGGNGESLVWTMTLTQNEGQVEGSIRMSSPDEQYFAVVKIEGQTSGRKFVFAGTQFVENLSGPNENWCLPAGKLQYSESNGVATLEGTWGSNDVVDGCPEGSEGHIEVSRGFGREGFRPAQSR